MAARLNAPPAATGPLTIELAIRLSDDSFETKVIMPLDADEDTRNKAISRWLKLSGEAMALGVDNLRATLPPDTPRRAALAEHGEKP
jgi:hypothetical protein